MSTSYFILEKGIIERQDLSIYEKMCCVVLAKWATETMDDFNMETLAEEMSCTLSKAKETIRQLKSKGFIQSMGEEALSEQIPKIIKAEDVEGLEPIDFSNPTELTPVSKELLMEQVRDIISEPLNDSEAKIILNFAGDDIERIKFCYKKAKNMQVGDKIEALMMELQRKEKPPTTLPIIIQEDIIETDQNQPNKTAIKDEATEEVIFNEESVSTDDKTHESNSDLEEKNDRPWYLDDDDDSEEPSEIIKAPSGNQINTNMIHKMKAYKKFGK